MLFLISQLHRFSLDFHRFSPIMYTSLDLFRANSLSEINKSFRKLCLLFHPDKIGPNPNGEHLEIIKYLTKMKTVVETFDVDVPIELFPIYLDYKGDLIPVLVQENGCDLEIKIDKFSGTKIERLIFQNPKPLKPWSIIKIQDKNGSDTTDIETIKTVYRPFLLRLDRNVLFNMMDEFIVGGKANFRCLVEPGKETVFLKLRGSEDLPVKVNGEISREDLTFNRLCCLLGELNRSFTGTKFLPGLARYIKLDSKVPSMVLYYLHHGVYFSWCFNVCEKNDLYHNRYIYMAVACLDLIFINLDLSKKRFKTFLKLSELLEANPGNQTWRHDFSKFIGHDRLTDFEKENFDFIKKWAPLIEYNN